MTQVIEIWRSVTNTDLSDFTLVQTVPDGAWSLSNNWSWVNTPVNSAQLYIYITRRFDSVSGLYSPFTALRMITGPEPQGNNMNINSTTYPGFGVRAAIGIEATYNALAKATTYLEYVSGAFTGGPEIAESDASRGVPGVTRVVRVRGDYTGQFVFELTPESMDEMFCLGMGAPVTTTVAVPATPLILAGAIVGTPGAVTGIYTVIAVNAQGDSAASPALTLTTLNAVLNGTNYVSLTITPVQGAVYYKILKGAALLGTTNTLSFLDQGQATSAYAAPSAPAGKQQLWSTNGAFLSGSLSMISGPINKIYGGVVAGKYGLKFDPKNKKPFRLTADLVAASVFAGLTQSQLGLNSAATDLLGGFTEAVATLQIAGSIADAETWGIDVDRNFKQKHSGTGYFAPSGQYLGGAKHKLMAKLWFSSDSEKQRFWGDVNAAGAYSLQAGILYFPVQLAMSQPVNAGGIVNSFGAYGANMTYKIVHETSNGKDEAIMQDVELLPLVDPGVTATDLQIWNINSRTNANIITPGTAITGLPANAFMPVV